MHTELEQVPYTHEIVVLQYCPTYAFVGTGVGAAWQIEMLLERVVLQ